MHRNKTEPAAFLQKAVAETIWYGIRLLFKYWLHLSCSGTQNLPTDGPYLLAANHTSHLDSVAVSLSLREFKKTLYSLGAKDYFANNSYKQLFFSSFFHVIPFNRRGHFIAGLRRCQSLITSETPILLFPEGTRSVTGELQAFKNGLGLIALNLGVPVVPVYINGAFQAMPKGRYLPKRQRLHIVYGKPVSIKPYQKQQAAGIDNKLIYREITQTISIAVKQLQRDFIPV